MLELQLVTRFAVAVLLAVSTGVGAETLYVTDKLEFNLRAGESTRYRIIKTLPSGTPVDVATTNEATGYAQVTTPDGVSGYIRSRYLQPEPTARSQVEDLVQQLSELKASPSELRLRIDALERELTRVKDRLTTESTAKAHALDELSQLRDAAANAITNARDKRRLQQQAALLKSQALELQQTVHELNDTSHQRWFLLGAGVLFIGLVAGFLLSRLAGVGRRSGWQT